MKIQDIVKSRYDTAFKNQSQKFSKFNDFDYIYNSKLEKNDPNIPSKVFNPAAWSFIETIVTRMLAKNPLINYKPREKNDGTQAKIMSDMFSYWFDKSGAYKVMVEFVKNALIYGTGIVKVDWFTSKERTIKSYVYDESGDAMVGEDGKLITQEIDTVVDYDDPRITNVNIYDFFIDPSATDIENADWVIHQYWANIDDLIRENEVAKEKGENLYNTKALNNLKKASQTKKTEFENNRKKATGFSDIKQDENTTMVKIWEMWSDDELVIIGDESEVLKNGDNPYWHGRKPFIKLVDSIVPHEFYGKGEIEPIEKQVYALNTTQNQRITNVNRILSPMWKANENVDDYELQFIDNGIIHVTQQSDADIITVPDVTKTAVQEQSVIMETMQRALGVTDYVQGVQTPGQTAKEVEVKTTQANARFAHKVKIFEETALRQIGEMVYKLYQQFLTVQRTVRVVGDEGEQYIPIRPADINGEFDVIPESESTLEVDREQEFNKYLNLLQILEPFFKTQVPDPITGQMVEQGFIDRNEFVKELLTKSGIKDPERFFDEQIPRGLQGITRGLTQGGEEQSVPSIEDIQGLQPAGQL